MVEKNNLLCCDWSKDVWCFNAVCAVRLKNKRIRILMKVKNYLYEELKKYVNQPVNNSAERDKHDSMVIDSMVIFDRMTQWLFFNGYRPVMALLVLFCNLRQILCIE